MTHYIKAHLSDLLRAALLGIAPDLADTPIALERPKQLSHGDFSCNLALQLARALQRPPRELVEIDGMWVTRRRHTPTKAL